jgi:uncharacterized membrane protein YedE/YeeE
MIEFLMNPWPWWFSGIVISVVMFTLLFFGKAFGVSSNLRTICSIAGAGKKVKFFQFDWKSQIWNLVFLAGAIIGGYIAKNFLSYDVPLELSEKTISDLSELGFNRPKGIQPEELFDLKNIFSLKGFLTLSIGGLLVGFGARYAGGCTSGHAISGISNLQMPSLIAVIGFFIGGLIMTHIIFPLIFN